ncbi:MAG: hypothetical protein M3O28_13315 [Actinomycetota bacterium]|nr:hypothetical protein [Actinomycetota bacterium]
MGAAVGHRLPSVSYRATADWLYWTSGRLGGRCERAPLWAVRDAQLRQSLQQRARRVGDVVVSLQHRDYLDAPTFVVLEDIDHPREAHRRITEAARACRRRHDEDA